MENVNLNCGQIPNFFPREQVVSFVETFKKFVPVDGFGNQCHGVDRNHLGYRWFQKSILDPVSVEFETEMKLIFSMFLDCVVPFKIHHDMKELPEPNGRHFISFLIPFAVEYDTNLCQNVSTLIFNEHYTHQEMITAPEANNNVSYLWSDTIGHVRPKEAKKFSLKKNLVWQTGDLLWWDSRLNHVSNNFLSKGIKSKQAIVTHTYVL